MRVGTAGRIGNPSHIADNPPYNRGGIRRTEDEPVKTTLRLALAVACLSTFAVVGAAEPPADDGWTVLFDSRDLGAWKRSPTACWGVEDGTITLADRTDGRLNNADYLWSRETYGDFILELEFKVCEGYANSGVFLRTAKIDDPVYTGIEVQVSNSYGRGLSRGGTAGAIYDCLAPTKNAAQPASQWNRYRITCQKNWITVVLNGDEVLRMDLDRWTETGKNPDGTPNKYPRPLKDFARSGYIGLQDHGRPVWYRKIRVKRLGD